MTPETILAECQKQNVTLGTDLQGGLTCRGDQVAIKRLLPAIRQHKPAILAILAGRPAATTVHLVDIDKTAANIAHDFKVDPGAVLALLDDDDREAIRTGSDPFRLGAWRGSVELLVKQGKWRAHELTE
jgi:hypothetical protein